MASATHGGVDIRLGAGVRIGTVQEQAWPGVELEFLLHRVAPEEFARTRAYDDARFVDPVTRLLRMSYHSTVIRTPQGTVLVDTCIGNHKHRPLIEPWHQQEFPYLERLSAIGLQPADIDFVCCTHLHADHVGWNTRLENGKWVPTFPNARYLFAEPELRYWEQVRRDDPGHIFSVSWDDSIAPVLAAGLGEAVAPDHEILPGVCLQPAFGHSPGNVVVDVRAGTGRAVMTGTASTTRTGTWHKPRAQRCWMMSPTATPGWSPRTSPARRRCVSVVMAAPIAMTEWRALLATCA